MTLDEIHFALPGEVFLLELIGGCLGGVISSLLFRSCIGQI